MHLPGLHHITAIAADPKRNLDFYTGPLGLRLVKKTVNFDDPTTYHLYYGDTPGSPGAILTFFPWVELPRGRVGAGQAGATAYSVPLGALEFWDQRLAAAGLAPVTRGQRFGEDFLAFTDPDGLPLELVATASPDPRFIPWTGTDVPPAHAIRGFHGITLLTHDPVPTASVLTRDLGYHAVATEGHTTRYTSGHAGSGAYLDLVGNPSLPRGRQGSGTVHHVAFRIADATAELQARQELLAAGHDVSDQINRDYFQSLYFREPAGILFEIATDPPGFAIDEAPDALGSSLRLPARYEPHRAKIEAALPPL